MNQIWRDTLIWGQKVLMWSGGWFPVVRDACGCQIRLGPRLKDSGIGCVPEGRRSGENCFD
eukprot:12411431-Karenia_brevis.AAC.1